MHQRTLRGCRGIEVACIASLKAMIRLLRPFSLDLQRPEGGWAEPWGSQQGAMACYGVTARLCKR